MTTETTINEAERQRVNVNAIVSDIAHIVDDRYDGLCRSPREIGDNSVYGQRNGVLGFWNTNR